MKQTTQPINATIRVLKIATCPTLSGKSQLIYHIGCTPDGQGQMRVVGNNGGGHFSPEWVALNAIFEALDKADKPITSHALFPLFSGKSVNTPAFLFAALRHEGLVEADKDKPRSYALVPRDVFNQSLKTLIDSKVDLKIEDADAIQTFGATSKPATLSKTATPSKAPIKPKLTKTIKAPSAKAIAST